MNSARQIRIVYVNHTGSVSGAERVLINMVRGLDRERFEPFVVCPADGDLMRLLSAEDVTCVALPLALWLGRSGVERALLAAPVLLILIVELLNSAIEATVDRIGMERHVLAGLAKDIGSAAVMLSFILLGVVWLLVLTTR